MAAPSCDDVADKAKRLWPAFPDTVAQSIQNCIDQRWPAETITCVVDAPTIDDAMACLAAPESALCAPLRQIIAAGEDGTFASIRGRLYDEADPNRYEPTVEPPDNTGCDLETYGSGKVRCQMVHTPELETVQTGYTQLAQAVQACLRTWTPTTGDNSVVFERPDLEQSVRVDATAYEWYDVYLVVTGSEGARRAPSDDVYYDDDDW